MKKILMLDDDQDVLDMIVSFLSSAGLEVRTATSSAEALAAAEEWRPDVLLTDVRLSPEDRASGIDVALALASSMADLRVIFMSGTMKDVDDRMGEMEEFRFRFHFQPKPFLLSKLMETIERCL